MIGLCDLKQTRVTADWFYCRFRNHFNSTISYNYIHSLVGFANTQTDIIWLIGKSWLSVSQQQTSCIASFLPCSSLREGLPGFNRTVDLYIANLTYTCKTAFYKTDCRDKDTACNSIKIPWLAMNTSDHIFACHGFSSLRTFLWHSNKEKLSSLFSVEK